MAKKKTKIIKKLLHRYRLVILNEDTFEERVSFKINRLYVIALLILSTIVIIALTSALIAYTPLKSYIPGYTTTDFKTEATKLNIQIDSLQQVVETKNAYFNSLRMVLKGETDTIVFNEKDVVETQPATVDKSELLPSKKDSLLRAEVEQEDKFNVFQQAVFEGDFTLFPPVQGIVSDGFNPKSKHYAVDIATDKNQSVKSVADGRVIFSEWTADTGYVIIIEHKFSLISVYKHNASLLKQQGDFVTSGEVVALTGNTGELSTGTHLHFELWSDGNPINPEEFINFN
ncbi:M23 family metallopeptidase [Flavobacterium sp. CS20]|jgi:murein DD-endopeptidase MepM/ murein hydrolase activator NlpD|uniref:M23 family metallopeptidase n=1 Tax=Flavobacterium sp. CS20 TaxID=2775246 RepID=UPI001B3A37F9|nr:M23 family metallopeptidase [Flavobacterium sp. CS20]QTY26576.1 M23 family metallopeptidase [Flavobacterium sp. CS20]